jgi:hypothetical protein
MIPPNCKRYQTIEGCYEILEKGIDAIIFNYDSTKQEAVTLVLDKGHTQLKVN